MRSDQRSNSNILYMHLVANSIFTTKQISIIYKRVSRPPLYGSEVKKEKEISSGAYYRQVKQCRNKVLALFYSVILLEMIGVMDRQTLIAIGRLTEQLRVIFGAENRDIPDENQMKSVMSLIDTLVKKMCKV